MNEKKILFLCQYFYPEYISSATLPFDTAVALRKAGFTVSALTGYPKEYNLTKKVPIKETYENIEISRLKYIQLKRSNFIGRIINYFSFTFSVALRFRQLKKYEAIIVYSNPPILPLIAAMANKFFNTKVVFVSYDVYPEIAYFTNTISKDSVMSKMMRRVNKSVFKHVNKVVALSNEMKAYLLKHRAALSEHQIEVIPNWYEDKGFSNATKIPENKRLDSIKTDENLIVSYFGNMGICQELDPIIEAIRQLKEDRNVQFLFAGHGIKMDHLKSVVETENLKNVRVFDFLHGQDFQDALSISDCFIVSLSDELTGLAVPSKTYSYMMAGKPVIAIIGADSDIARDLIEHHAGYAMQVKDSSKLVNVIKELLHDRVQREYMGENCRKLYLEKYTTEKCTEKYVNLMQKLLGE
ncbi:capsular biosynthesis protein [Lysinibacillus contaminans]|uniref:Capsular biosynthesis protein n=1 Tax=Lysinibacillus contaminans TaxID=1293441 RepID=A0ABR5K3E7_9BACI|nr:glycosyltransferase family 4 protein [Lysinibacillus contaminans]KOS69386.1 capsular biosynthesis protein [Lysinibacillus contaminans]